MLKEIDKSNLKLCYILGIAQPEKDLEEFLWDMMSAYLNKEWDPAVGRTIIQLNWAGLSDPIKDMTMDESLKLLEDSGFIEMFEDKGSIKYKIINHPW